jgi:hypothetical protein
MSDFAGTERWRRHWPDQRIARSRGTSTHASRVAHGGPEATRLVAQWSVDRDGRLRCTWAKQPDATLSLRERGVRCRANALDPEPLSSGGRGGTV